MYESQVFCAFLFFHSVTPEIDVRIACGLKLQLVIRRQDTLWVICNIKVTDTTTTRPVATSPFLRTHLAPIKIIGLVIPQLHVQNRVKKQHLTLLHLLKLICGISNTLGGGVIIMNETFFWLCAKAKRLLSHNFSPLFLYLLQRKQLVGKQLKRVSAQLSL